MENRKIVDYIVIHEEFYDDFIEKVYEKIQLGYIPLGGITCPKKVKYNGFDFKTESAFIGYYESHLMQAMVKYEIIQWRTER